MKIINEIAAILVSTLGCLLVLWAVAFTFESLFDKVLSIVKVKVIFCEYIWHQKQFKRWLAANCDLTPEASNCSEVSDVAASRKPENERRGRYTVTELKREPEIFVLYMEALRKSYDPTSVAIAQEVAEIYATDYSAKCAETDRLRGALEKSNLALLQVAARFARREFVMNIENCRTIRDVRRNYNAHDCNHVNVAYRLKSELDAIKALTPAASDAGENDAASAARKGKTTSSDMEADRKDK